MQKIMLHSSTPIHTQVAFFLLLLDLLPINIIILYSDFRNNPCNFPILHSNVRNMRNIKDYVP